MAECTACRAEIAAYDRRCWNCGAGVVRDANSLLANAPTDKELSRARFAHLLTLPGMLILGFFFFLALEGFGLVGLFPLNLLIPLVYWLLYQFDIIRAYYGWGCAEPHPQSSPNTPRTSLVPVPLSTSLETR